MINTSKIQNIFRVLLGTAMLYAGIAHLTIRKIDFRAQVPSWITTELDKIDTIVAISGIVEITIGLLLIFYIKRKVEIGIGLAIFFVLVFPGNWNQYVNQLDAFVLNTDRKRLIRLLFQPVLVIWALWSSGGLEYLKIKYFKNNKNINE